MNFIEKLTMVMVFVLAGLSAIMWYGEGFHNWFWQLVVMAWVVVAYLKQKQIDNLK